MQIAEAINTVLGLKQGYEYTHEQLLGWLNACEQLIWVQVISHYEQDEYPEMPVYTAEDSTKQLMIPEPFSRLYVHYLGAQMHYYNRETTGYINEKEQYTNMLTAFIADYMRTHKHKAMPYFKGVKG